MIRRCVLYARISVTKEESVSVDRQLDAGRKLAEARGWEVVGEFVDDGVSATANRPEDRAGWSALLRTPDIDAVVIWKVDRLARKVLDFLHVDQVLQARGAGLIAVEDPIDMTSPMGRAFATILAVFGEMEAAAISSRVKAARGHLIKTGRFSGGTLPYGYMSEPNPEGPGRVRAFDPERVDWLRQIIERAMRGETANAISVWLAESGAPAPRESPSPETHQWHRQTIGGLLRNPMMAGLIPHNPGIGKSGGGARRRGVLTDSNGDLVVVESLALITVSQYEELQRTLDASDHPASIKSADRQKTSPFLSRVARCDDCGVYMCRGTNRRRPVLYCPQCRQTMSRGMLDPYLEKRLLDEHGDDRIGTVTVRVAWRGTEGDDRARRALLLSQLASLRIRRGVVGRTFDADRVLIKWRSDAERDAA